ncbi:Hsp33 family molecular chaperone HslO [Peribacillus frigoritolerans]|uniref:Hsp33 family molecular chaperone HslO n=1 Tax=Peribacillus frigoritolerans TaxID=450367 RepID=UPI003D6DA6CD
MAESAGFNFHIKSAVGTNGILSVTKDIGLTYPFIGQVPIATGEIGEDFYILSTAFRTSTFLCWSRCLSKPGLYHSSCCGFIVQLMPNTEEETIHTITINNI